MICTTYFLTFFSELIPPTGIHYNEFTSEICGSWYNYKFVSIYNAGVSFVYVSTDK